MTFTAQLIDNIAPGESLRSGATKINTNFKAIAQEFDVGVPDLIDSMFGSTFVHIETDILSINYIPVIYSPTLTPSVSATDQLGAHLHGIDLSLAAIWTELSDDSSEWASISHGALNHSGTIGTESQVTFDSTGGHDHDGSDSKTIDHTNILNKGLNTHSQIDSFVSSKAAATGLASLDESSKVIQNPANATTTPGADKIPIADSSGKLNSWLGYGDGSGEVCAGDDQRIPTTDQKAALSGTVGEPGANNPLVTNEDVASIAIELNADLLELNYSPSAYTAELTPEVASTSQMAAHLAGINAALRAIQDRLTALEP